MTWGHTYVSEVGQYILEQKGFGAFAPFVKPFRHLLNTTI